MIPTSRRNNILKHKCLIQHKIVEMLSHFQADSTTVDSGDLTWCLCCVGARRNFAVDLLPGEPGSDLGSVSFHLEK